MAGSIPSKKPRNREDRLKAALKANMAKRKAQARARDTGRDTGGVDAGRATEAGKDKQDG